MKTHDSVRTNSKRLGIYHLKNIEAPMCNCIWSFSLLQLSFLRYGGQGKHKRNRSFRFVLMYSFSFFLSAYTMRGVSQFVHLTISWTFFLHQQLFIARIKVFNVWRSEHFFGIFSIQVSQVLIHVRMFLTGRGVRHSEGFDFLNFYIYAFLSRDDDNPRRVN